MRISCFATCMKKKATVSCLWQNNIFLWCFRPSPESVIVRELERFRIHKNPYLSWPKYHHFLSGPDSSTRKIIKICSQLHKLSRIQCFCKNNARRLKNITIPPIFVQTHLQQRPVRKS